MRHCFYLFHLHYLLLWAQLRSSKGRTFLSLNLCILGALFFLFLSYGGFTAVFIAIKLGKEFEIARLVFSSAFISSILMTVIRRGGGQIGFPDESLRRYPLSEISRFIIRHSVSLFEPTWLFFTSLILGISRSA